MTSDQYAILKEHKEVWETYKTHRFFPSSSQPRLKAIESVYMEVFSRKVPVDMWCPGCVEDMLRQMYSHFDNYENEQARRTEALAKEIILPKIQLNGNTETRGRKKAFSK